MSDINTQQDVAVTATDVQSSVSTLEQKPKTKTTTTKRKDDVVLPVAETKAEVVEKTLDVVDAATLVEKVKDVSIYSNCVSDWVTLHKVSSESEGWFKSTKALDLKTGVLIQVTTQQGDNVAEALQYCHGVKLVSLLKG